MELISLVNYTPLRDGIKAKYVSEDYSTKKLRFSILQNFQFSVSPIMTGLAIIKIDLIQIERKYFILMNGDLLYEIVIKICFKVLQSMIITFLEIIHKKLLKKEKLEKLDPKRYVLINLVLHGYYFNKVLKLNHRIKLLNVASKSVV